MKNYVYYGIETHHILMMIVYDGMFQVSMINNFLIETK